MSSEQNKDIVYRFVEEIFEKGNLSVVDQLVAPDLVHHSWPFASPGIEGLKQVVGMVHSALSQTRLQVKDTIAEGDKVVVRMAAHAVHTGELMGIPATGKEFNISEIHIFRLSGGKVAEHWREADLLGMMQQLGVIPAPGQSGS